EELNQLQQQLLGELESIQGSDEQLAELEQQISASLAAYQSNANKLSKQRQQAAKQLSVAVSERMQGLGMPGGKFVIELSPHQDSTPNPLGQENVEFLVSANPGQPVKSLGKVASGGELSRISLAIQVITAQTSR